MKMNTLPESTEIPNLGQALTEATEITPHWCRP